MEERRGGQGRGREKKCHSQSTVRLAKLVISPAPLETVHWYRPALSRLTWVMTRLFPLCTTPLGRGRFPNRLQNTVASVLASHRKLAVSPSLTVRDTGTTDTAGRSVGNEDRHTGCS